MLPDWTRVRFVVFDVDGTLYRQRRLRIMMAMELLAHSILKRDRKHIVVLAAYRHLREQLGNEEGADFGEMLVARTAAAAAALPDDVRAIVSEWIEQRPLRYLAACRYPGISELFAGMRRCGKSIGVLSDYPAEAKLTALGLSADHIVFAGDARDGLLKPHPRGLELLMAAAGVEPNETVLIGDRVDRDGAAAQRAGVHTLIRSSRPIEGWQTFARYDEALFAPLL